MSQALTLFRLQRIDSHLDQISDQISRMEGELSVDLDLENAKSNAQEALINFEKAERELNKADQDAKSQQLKIEQTESSLYSGTIKNPKELQDLQMDLISLRRHLSTLEDKQLEAMSSYEITEKMLNENSVKLHSEEKRNFDNNLRITIGLSTIRKEKEKLETERRAVVDSLDSRLTHLYETIRKQKGGIAVSEILDTCCNICGATLTPSQSQIVHSSTTIVHCPSCGRILYGN